MPEAARRRTQRTRGLLDSDFELEQDFSIRLKRAKEQLTLLREREEHIDNERKDLEALKMDTEELDARKREITGRLTDAVSLLEQMEQDARQEQQEVIATRKEFEILIRQLRTAEKKTYKVDDVRHQILIETEIIDKARDAFDRSRKRLDFLEEKIAESNEESEEARPAIGMVEGFKVGVGFFLAGGIVAIIVWILLLILRP